MILRSHRHVAVLQGRGRARSGRTAGSGHQLCCV